MADSPSLCGDARENLTPEGPDDTIEPNGADGDSFSQTPSATRQLFRDGTVDRDDELAESSLLPPTPGTPSCLTSTNNEELVVADAAEELNEEGDGDSTASAEEIEELDSSCEVAFLAMMTPVTIRRIGVLFGVEVEGEELSKHAKTQ